MHPSTRFAERATPRLNPWALTLWALLGAITVLLLVHLLHDHMNHAAAIVTAAIVGLAVGALGYRWTSGDRSGRGIAVAGLLGGGAGLVVLHILPLLH